MLKRKENFWYSANRTFYKRYYALICLLCEMLMILGNNLLDRDYLFVNSNAFYCCATKKLLIKL